MGLPAGALAVGASGASAQVDVTATAGTLNASYTTLKGAFDAINAGTHQATITIGISGDTTETAPAVLSASGAGAAVYTTIGISPTGGAARTISGAIAAGSPLIDLNGADNVTIDGLNTGGSSLTIANTTVSATAGTSTIRFIGGATGNVITHSNIQGSSSSSVATVGGTILISTDAVTTNGNDNNTISNNDIGPAGANLPTKAVYGLGSTTTTAIGNSGNIINNNNIFDYFGAAVTSAGIATTAGCNTWSITNNRFYQTGTRTWTTGAVHAAINIGNTTATSGAQGFTITGNTIGFASNTQTGTYTLTGAGTGAKFVGIQLSGITGGIVSNINSNTVAAVSMTGVTSSGTSTNSPFMGIIVVNGPANTNSNTVGSPVATGSLTLSTTTTASTDIYGIFNFSVDDWTANSNNVGGISATNLGASGTFIIFGMRANTNAARAFSATSNNVGGTVANSIQLMSTGAASQVLGMVTTLATATHTLNTVRNLTNNNGAGTTTAASVIGMSYNTSTPNHTVTQNTIFALSNTHATVGTVVTGIQFTGATANLVARNLIYGLTTASNSTAAEVNGIRVSAGTTVYRNNMIAVGAGIANAIGTGSTTGGINGIFEASGSNSFFHNSVYVGGSPAAGVGPSYAFASTQATVVRSNRDNVYWNARSNGGATGKNYVLRVAGTAPNPTGLTMNNNVYFANGTGAVFGFFNAADVPNLIAWRTAVGQDSASIEGNPAYNDPTNAVPDLHIHPTNATVIESNGADVGVTDDFDGQTRSGLSPVDIGADAGNFNGIDLAPPIIAYSPLGNTTSTSNRPLAATITDAGSGVPIAGVGLPVIYFRKGNVGAFAATQATSDGAGVYNFTIDYSLVAGGSVAIGDTIQYYVVAQDAAATPNVISNPVSGAGWFTANPPAAATPPTPNSYLISAPISGIKTVCAAGCDFATLTGATGMFKAINDGVATGNVEIQIAGDLVVGEDGTTGLNALSEQPAGSNFTVRIYPTGVARAITGAFNGALIRMNGASRVTIDGSLGGVGTDRSLTIANTSVTAPSVILFGSVGPTPVTNDTLKNSIVINGVNTSSAVVISDATVVGNAGLFSNITIQNNDVQRAFVGVFATGGTTPQGGSNLVYTENTLTTSGANAIRNVGLYMQGVLGATVSQNTVGNFSATEGENDTGIWLASGTGNSTVSGNTVNNLGMTLTTGFAPFGIRESSGLAASGNNISGNTVTNLTTTGSTGLRGIALSSTGVTVQANRIQGIINNNTGTFGSFGIDVIAGNGAVIKNNFVSDVNHNMTGGAAFGPDFGVIGIRMGAGTGHRVYSNSVNLFGPHTGTATTSLLSAAFSISTTAQTGIDVRDNIFANNITGGTTSIAHVSVFLPSGATAAMNLTWNNNAYFFGTDVARQGVGQAGTTAGANFFTTLPALAAYTSTLSPAGTNDNASSASTGAVPFLTATDLHLQPMSPLASAGVPLPGVTTDIDNETRSTTAPSIGADEVVADLSITKTDGTPTATSGGSTTYTITASNAGPGATMATVADTFPATLTCTWTCLGALGGVCTAAGSGNINDVVTLPAGGSVTYTASCSISSSATGSLANTATVTGVAGDPNTADNSATDTDTLVASADLSITKDDGVATATPGGSVTYTITASNAGPSNTTATVTDGFIASLTCTWTCVGAGGGSCTAAGSGNINDAVTLPLGGSVTYLASCSISVGASGSLANTATVTITGGGTDPNPGNDSATDTDTLVGSSDIALTKSVDNPTPGLSTNVVFTVTASNNGPSNATGVAVNDLLPVGLAFVSATPSTGSCSNVTGLWTIGSLGNGASATLTITATVNRTQAMVNQASKSAEGEVDPRGNNNTATVRLNGTPLIDIQISQSVDDDTPTISQNVTFLVTARNAGPATATGVILTSNLPAGLTHVSNTPSQGTYTPGTGAWNVGTLASGASATLSVQMTNTVSTPVVQTFTKTAAAEQELVAGNDAASVVLNPTAPGVDLALSKITMQEPVASGLNFSYVVVATNLSAGSATGVVVTDMLPAGVTLVSSAATQGSCSGVTTVTCNLGTLLGGGSATINLVVTKTVGGSVSNTAMVSGTESDPNPANNTNVAGTTPVALIGFEIE